MSILLTNDDGIFAPGLLALWGHLRDRARVTVVAPDTELSGSSHAISMRKPILCHPVSRPDGFTGFALEGTPADCVKVGISELMSERPDMVVSGINLGANAGIHVLYSGTVAAAVEGAMAHVCSVAVSLTWSEHPDFERAARLVTPLLGRLRRIVDSHDVAFNVNVPAGPGEVRGVRVVRQSCVPISDKYVRRTDPRGRMYFWIEGDVNARKAESDSDRASLTQDWITITPLRYDMTDERMMSSLMKVDWTKAV